MIAQGEGFVKEGIGGPSPARGAGSEKGSPEVIPLCGGGLFCQQAQQILGVAVLKAGPVQGDGVPALRHQDDEAAALDDLAELCIGHMQQLLRLAPAVGDVFRLEIEAVLRHLAAEIGILPEPESVSSAMVSSPLLMI